MSDPEKVPVQVAISRLIAEMPSIGKAGKAADAQGGYAYRGIEQITGALQTLLAKHGIVVVPNATVTTFAPAAGMKDNWTDAVITVAWTIIGPEGDAIQAQTIGMGRDGGDKAFTKAQSQAYKYLWLDLLCIADKKDDADGADYSGGHADTRRPRSNPQPQVETAGLALYKRLKDPMSDASKTKLKEIAGTYQLKLTANDLDANPEYANEVRLILDGTAR